LGIPKLEVLNTGTTLKQGLTLLNNLDPAVAALLRATQLEKKLEKLAKNNDIPWPITRFEQIDNFKKQSKSRELLEWHKLPCKGKSVPSFTDDRFGNAWLYDPALIKPNRFNVALRMRSGTTADRVTLNTSAPQATVKCRRCSAPTESLPHILGQCIATKPQRMRRHNDIRDFITNQVVEADKNIKVMVETSFVTPNGTLKPDLVVVDDEKVFIVDATVRHEVPGYLQEGYNEKLRKYTPLLPILMQQFNCSSGKVLPVVVGTRGAIPKSTIASLEELRIKKPGKLITIALTALRSSTEIYLEFLDYNH
jgi:hypothetical protein